LDGRGDGLLVLRLSRVVGLASKLVARRVLDVEHLARLDPLPREVDLVGDGGGDGCHVPAPRATPARRALPAAERRRRWNIGSQNCPTPGRGGAPTAKRSTGRATR